MRKLGHEKGVIKKIKDIFKHIFIIEGSDKYEAISLHNDITECLCRYDDVGGKNEKIGIKKAKFVYEQVISIIYELERDSKPCF